MVVAGILHQGDERIMELARSPVGQGVIGFQLGLFTPMVYGPLTEKIVEVLGVSAKIFTENPFKVMDLGSKILVAPLICLIGPVMEEVFFRGSLQDSLKSAFRNYYGQGDLSESMVDIAARVTAVFFSSIIFGLIHFTNALMFWCNPILFLPQVVAATLLGLIFGFVKEVSGDLHMPIGMHIGNNTLAWTMSLVSA